MADSTLSQYPSCFLPIAYQTGIPFPYESGEVLVDSLSKELKPWKEIISGCIKLSGDVVDYYRLYVYPETSLCKNKESEYAILGIRFYCRFDKRMRNGGESFDWGNESFEDLVGRFINDLEELQKEFYEHLVEAKRQINSGVDLEFVIGGKEKAGKQDEENDKVMRYFSSKRMKEACQETLRSKGDKKQGIPPINFDSEISGNSINLSEPVRKLPMKDGGVVVREGKIDCLSRKNKNFILVGAYDKDVKISYDPKFEEDLAYYAYKYSEIKIYVREKYYKLTEQNIPGDCEVAGFVEN